LFLTAVAIDGNGENSGVAVVGAAATVEV